MDTRPYEDSMLFMGILSSRGFPSTLRERLESLFGPIDMVSDRIPFIFTDYYSSEMGEGIERFLISFSRLLPPDRLAAVKTETNLIEAEYAEEGKRRINLDPGLITESSIILATTKNRAHRIAIGMSMYAEVTLIYHRSGFEAFPWTYQDYRSPEIQEVLREMRKHYLVFRKEGQRV